MQGTMQFIFQSFKKISKNSYYHCIVSKFSTYIAIALASTIKFVGGPIAGIAFKENWIMVSICSTIGMMISVSAVLFFGDKLISLGSKLFPNKNRKIFTRTNRWAVKVKKSLGLWGIAFLTPFLFTPILGSFIALSFKFPKSQIFVRMLICGLVAGYLQTAGLFYLKDFFVGLF